MLSLNTTYSCDNSKLNLVIRNNINGDFSIIRSISEIKAGAFVNISWKEKNLMLPYSLKKDYLSFTDNKWDWRYIINEDGSLNISNPVLYELMPSGEVKKHICQFEEDYRNL